MGCKRIAGTPGRETSQPTLTSVWKCQNQANPPAGLRSYAQAASIGDEQSSQDSSSVTQYDFNGSSNPDFKLSAKSEKDDHSEDSNATEKIENLHIHSLEIESTIVSTSSSLATADNLSLEDYPLLPYKNNALLPSTPTNSSGNNGKKNAQLG